MIELLRDLILHQEWADSEFFRLWAFTGHVNDPDLLKRTRHIVLLQTWFVTALRKEEITVEQLQAQTEKTPDFDELQRTAQENHVRAKQLLESVWEEDLNVQILLPWFPDPPCKQTMGEAVIQMAMHTQGHRSQNLMQLKKLGAAEIALDLVVWKWKGQPAPSWI